MKKYFSNKTARLLVAALLLGSAPMVPGAVHASELEAYIMSVQLQNTTLKELFDLIEEKFDYSFLIRNNDIDLDERITIDMTDRSVEEILKNALKNQDAEFVVNENRIIVYKSSVKSTNAQKPEVTQVAQQTIKVTGVVIDAMTGDPVIGANLLVKGSSTGTSTDFDGNFAIDVPAGTTLIVSYIGYNNQEVLTQAGPMTIRLVEDTQALDEVVVVGYSVQKKESLTGAMQVVSGEKLNSNTTPAVENLLTGKAPGVFANPGEGQPGQAGKIIIRGKSTVNGSTDPLWVVDGVIIGTSSGDLNPEDIASMSILKDAASTAIYGSQGANGVIVVTTKRGRAGKSTINASVKLGVSQLNKNSVDLMSGAELYDYFKLFPNQEKITFSRYNDDLRNANFNWMDEGTQLGFTQQYAVSASGGTDKIRTYVSLGYYNESGAVKDYDFTRYNFRFNVEYDVTNWLKIKPQVSASRRDIMDQQVEVSSFYSMLPWDSPYDEEGGMVGDKPASWVNNTKTNPWHDLQYNFNKATGYEFMGNLDFDIKLTDWLTFSSVNNYRYTSFTRKEYVDPRAINGMSDQGSLKDRIVQSYRVYSNQLLRFNKMVDKHSISALLGYEWNTATDIINEGVVNGFDAGFTVANAAALPRSVDGTQTEEAVTSVFFNTNYAYDNKYLAQFSIRRDGASNFGIHNKYGTFFSISGGWNIHREDFFTADFVDQLKLRVSYGSNGNRPTARYPQYALYETIAYDEIPGGLLFQIENKDLTWEKTFSTGVGLDITMFNRLNITLDYYNKNTSNLLYKVPLPSVTGIKEAYRNVGSVKNNGFEATVSVDILRDVKDWDWGIDANIGFNRNKVSELYGEQTEIIIPTGSGTVDKANKILAIGEDVDTWYLTEWAGVDSQTGQPQWYTTDENGERVITDDYGEASKHKVKMGKYTPDVFGGFSTNLRYRDFDLSALFTYTIGGKIYNYTRIEYDSDGAYTDRNQFNLKKGWTRWEKPGDIATHPQAIYGNASGGNQGSSRHLEDGSYLKMKSLTLGYNLPLKVAAVSNLRIYFTAENLFTITGFSGIDPELPPNVTNRTRGESAITGVATSIYPQTRKFMFGLNITL